MANSVDSKSKTLYLAKKKTKMQLKEAESKFTDQLKQNKSAALTVCLKWQDKAKKQ